MWQNLNAYEPWHFLLAHSLFQINSNDLHWFTVTVLKVWHVMCVHAHTHIYSTQIDIYIYTRIHALWIGSWLTMPWDCQPIQFWLNWCRVKPSRPWCINSWPSASASVRILLGSVENAFKVLDDALPWMALMRPWMSRFQRWKLVHQVQGNRQQQPARLFEDSYGQPILLGWVHCDEIRGLPLPLRLRPSNRGGLCAHKKKHCLENYERHIERVKQVIPPQKLLVYNWSDGLGSFGAFLGASLSRRRVSILRWGEVRSCGESRHQWHPWIDRMRPTAGWITSCWFEWFKVIKAHVIRAG